MCMLLCTECIFLASNHHNIAIRIVRRLFSFFDFISDFNYAKRSEARSGLRVQLQKGGRNNDQVFV